MSDMHGEMDHSVDAADEVVDPVAAVEPTGHAQIDEALQRLDRLGDLPITEHPEEFDAMHGVLRESLANAGRDEVELDSP